MHGICGYVSDTGCLARGVFHIGYIVRRNSKGKIKIKSRQKNPSKIVWNMEGKNVGIIRVKSPKQGLTRAEDLTIELLELRESPYHRLD